MSRTPPMSYERRLRSYGLRDASGPTGRTATPAQLRRLKQKDWHREAARRTSPAEPAAKTDPVMKPEPKKRWTIEDIRRGALRTR